MAIANETFDAPYKDAITDGSGRLTTAWTWFYKALIERIYPLGVERSFTLANNQSAAASIDGMKVNARGVSQAVVEYLVQRVTTGAGATDLIESGLFILTYNPTDEAWALSVVSEELPDDSGVEFSVTADGQVQYTTSDITGTASLSRVVWRMRTLSAKSTSYSSQGTR